MTRAAVLHEESHAPLSSGADMMRNRCAFTSRDMAAEWPEAFTYAVVFGWEEATKEVAARFGWDTELLDFLADAHERFEALSKAAGV